MRFYRTLELRPVPLPVTLDPIRSDTIFLQSIRVTRSILERSSCDTARSLVAFLFLLPFAYLAQGVPVSRQPILQPRHR